MLLYHMPVVEELLEDMDHIVAQSQLYTLEDWRPALLAARTTCVYSATGSHLAE
ncbi:MAG: hypothetical protein ACLSHO_09495 [Dysosmobacter sp.]